MKILKEIGSWIVYIIVAFIIASLLNIFVFQITRVQGSSMFPTLKNGDLYVISKIGSSFNSCPDYGDIIVIDSRTEHVRSLKDDFTDIIKYNALSTFISQSHDDVYWVKRVIGLPGDKIELRNGRVIRNGTPLDEPYTNKEEYHSYSNINITVPDGYIWVMGDNRNHSSDSRVIGPVPIQNVIGTLKFKLKSGR